jgi:L-methionine (R)-S-oxide reductase
LTDTITTNNALSLEEKYKLLQKQLRSLLNKEENLLSNLSNFTAALNQTFDKISWVGFYLFDGQKLYLGPFQGKVACTLIEIGKGVCGTSAEKRESVVVQDVERFPGHIACDPESRSEIVVPIIKNDNLFGVLDVDSRDLNSFSVTDKKYLEEFCSFLSSEII